MNHSKVNIRTATLAITQIAVCTALLCVLSPLSIPTPIAVPFTLQVMIVLLTALVLKPLYALAAQTLYTVLGLLGLPVFSMYKSGLAAILSPTGGFLIGFILASFFVSLLKGGINGKYAVVRYILTAILIGIPCIYIPGIIGFMLAAGADFASAFRTVAAMFLAVDAVKCVIAGIMALPIGKSVAKL